MKTIKQFALQSSIDDKLIRAVVRQFGGWQHFLESAPDVASHGADAGFSGFTYYADTVNFYARNKSLILKMSEEMAQDLDETMQSMIMGFNCLQGVTTMDAIGVTLWGTKSKYDTSVANALAWFALEEVARAYVDFLEVQP